MSKTYETVIGLEVHVELATKTKIFCGCSTAFGGAPNTHTCPVCTGMPGSLPVLNKAVVEKAVAVGLATNCTITQNCKFDRKNYFYPDNPQNYQISQLYYPICRNGKVEIEVDGNKKYVRIHEIHMEEKISGIVVTIHTSEGKEVMKDFTLTELKQKVTAARAKQADPESLVIGLKIEKGCKMGYVTDTKQVLRECSALKINYSTDN